VVDLLQAAVVRRRQVHLTYTNAVRQRTERLVHPLGLVDKDNSWYLVAGTDDGQRTFRVDRIEAVEPTDRPADRPDGFRLDTAWQQVVAEVEGRRSRTWATVLVEPRFVPVLRTQFGRHCHPDGQPEAGRVRVRLGAPTALDVARHLAGWGALIEVLAPAAVQAELARIGAELTDRYRPPA
jgi:predicted DNA-binding transcriptional regulator YafY